MVLAAYVVNAGKEADYEKVIATLKDALAKSPKPEAKQQLAGWKVIKNSANQPDGSPLYVHIITPVVKDADYSIRNSSTRSSKTRRSRPTSSTSIKEPCRSRCS